MKTSSALGAVMARSGGQSKLVDPDDSGGARSGHCSGKKNGFFLFLYLEAYLV